MDSCGFLQDFNFAFCRHLVPRLASCFTSLHEEQSAVDYTTKLLQLALTRLLGVHAATIAVAVIIGQGLLSPRLGTGVGVYANKRSN